MKKLNVALAFLLISNTSFARDDALMLPLAEVIQMGIEQGKLDGSVKFYLSGSKTPRINTKMGEDVANKKTNGVGKDDVTACNWAALSALIAFEAKAKQSGANAVLDLHSFYKKNARKDPVNYECHAGNIMTGVALKGTYAQVEK